MLRNYFPKGKNKRPDIRWRSHDVHRVEAFSDAVFAFSVTLLVVSLEVPKTFHDLYNNFFAGMLGFAIGFLLVMLVWYDHYLFFRRYGLKDTRTIFWTIALLFVVLFYVYPTKFLFTFIFSNNRAVEHGETVRMVQSAEEMRQLFVMYGVGFAAVYFILWQTYLHAARQADELQLSVAEKFATDNHVYQRLLMFLIGVLAIAVVYLLPPERAALSGYVYLLIYPAISVFYYFRRRKMPKLPDETGAPHPSS